MSKQAITELRGILDRAEASRALIDLSAHASEAAPHIRTLIKATGSAAPLIAAVHGIAGAQSQAEVQGYISAARTALDDMESQMGPGDPAAENAARPSRPPAESKGRARAKRPSRAKGGK